MFKSSHGVHHVLESFFLSFFLRLKVNNNVVINMAILNSLLSLNNIFCAEAKY